MSSGRPPCWRAAQGTKGVKPLSEESLDQQRQKLLNLLFGADVPAVLEGQLLRTADVALLFEVSERTVSEWAKKGQIPSVRTPGGHRRYPAEGIRWLLEESRRGSRPTDPGSSRSTSAASVTRMDRRSLA